MILSLIGAIDLRGFIGVDGRPFRRSSIFSQLLSDITVIPSSINIKTSRSFVSAIEDSLKCNWSKMQIGKAHVPFPLFPLFGDSLVFRTPKTGLLVNNLRETASDLTRSGKWGTYKYIEIDSERALHKRIDFDKERCLTILNNADISIEFWVSSPGIIITQIDLESSDPDFVIYWYPCFSAIEFSTYHINSLTDLYEGAESDQLPDLTKIRHAGSFNECMKSFRIALCDHLKPIVRLEYPDRQIDELETGFYSVLRISTEENRQSAIDTATALNEYNPLIQIHSDPYTTYMGWAAACIVTATTSDSEGDGSCSRKSGQEDEKAIYDLKLCMFVYNIFFFYDRALGHILSEYVFSHSEAFPSRILSIHRTIGNSVQYLGDLRRASQYGSDRKLFEEWIKISNLDYLRAKTSELTTLIVSRMEEKNNRRTQQFLTWIGIISFVLGLSSIAVWITALQSYVDFSGRKLSPSDVLNFLESTTPGHWLLLAYGLVVTLLLVLFLANWLWQWGRGSVLTGSFRRSLRWLRRHDG